jgi:DNA-binding IclR family transcriptional regulator
MSEEAEKRIIECLKKVAPKDLSIEEIAAATGMHRNTASKYVYGLEKAGKIVMSRTVGRARFYVIRGKA